MKRGHPDSKPPVPAEASLDNEDEDDYMSMAFLEQESSTAKSKKAMTYSEKRRRDMELSRQRGSSKSVREKEAEAREAGLKTTVLTDDNKGLAMLQKMGFKKGMALGKHDDGTNQKTKLLEPISVTMKSGHGGLGIDSHQRELDRAREAELNNAVKLTEDEYRIAAAKRVNDRQVEGELVRARKALQQLDESAGVSQSDMWISEPKQRPPKDELDLMNVRQQVFKNYEAYYAELAADGESGDEREENEEDGETAFDRMELHDKFALVHHQLRSVYFYCIWCGDRYKDSKEMEELCPGPTREDHDE
ncbi:G patch domain-containing protein 11 [Chytriomyces hyalinus]|nr:G patch domain-containing protein 11 [Chytriomyces hyalinus]